MLREMLVAVLVAVTVAFWTKAPVVSVTVPLTDAVCASALRTRTSVKLVATANRTSLRSIVKLLAFISKLFISTASIGGHWLSVSVELTLQTVRHKQTYVT
jgi:hypothetical protein